LFKTETDAQKAKDVLDGAVSMARGFAKSGSVSEKMLRDIKTSSNGDIVSLGLDVTTEDWNKLQEELKSSSASGQTGTGTQVQAGTNGGRGIPSPTTPDGQGLTAPSPGIDQTEGDLVEFYGEECPHCQNMKPIVAQVEEETGVTFIKLEVWHNAENNKVFQSYSATISAKCGGLGVPTFYNLRTGEAICGETSKETLTAFIEADQGS
jgi:thiol-disulfide isomerase/thioredoxin